MKKIVKKILGLGVPKIFLGVSIALIVISGAGVGIYFATKTDDPVKTATPKNSIALKDIEEAFSTYSNAELKEFTTYLNRDNNANIVIIIDDSEDQRKQKIWEFYKYKDNFNWEVEKDIINEFKSIYSVRNTFLTKELDGNIRTTLENSLIDLETAQLFAAQEENVLVSPSDSKEMIIEKIVNWWSNTLRSKTQVYFVWNNFRDDNFLSYAKRLNNQITSLDDIKALSPQNLYQLHYDCLTEYFKDRISVFNALNTMQLGKLQIFIQWLNSEIGGNFPFPSKMIIIPAYIQYYQNEKLTFLDVNKQIDDFNIFYNVWLTYLSKELVNSRKSELEAKFDSIAKITPFANQEEVSISPGDLLANIITKIIDKWNEDLQTKTGTIPLIYYFETNDELLNIALNENAQLSSLEDIKNLAPSTLYQIHYEAWNEYYRQKISNYSP